MLVYRICKAAYANDLSGEGARLFGGRWNHKGTAVVYTSESSSLAMLELLVHTDLRFIQSDFQLMEIALSEHLKLQSVKIKELDKNWRNYPAPNSLKQLGSNWVNQNQFDLLRVPSAINPLECNILLNPKRISPKDYQITKLTPLSLDSRLYESKW